MATVVPPPSKRQRREDAERARTQQDVTAILPPIEGSLKARFVDAEGAQLADVVEVPLADASEKNISLLLNALLEHDTESTVPYRFRVQIPGKDLSVDWPGDILALLNQHGVDNPFETTVTLCAEPQAVFKVQAVSRLAHRIPGHGQPVLCAAFSPASGSRLATGSGDNTARIWDTDTGTPKFTLKGHSNWVLGVAWAPDASRLATCSMDGTVILWDPETGKQEGSVLRGHAKWVNALAWEPYHLWRDGTPRLVSASKDCTARIVVVNTGQTEHILSGHKGSVTCVRWGGTGLIYTGSHDKTLRVWNAEKGTLVHELKAHAHWINHMALSTDAVLRTGYFDHTKEVPATDENKREKARQRFETAAKVGGKVMERLVSASDDLTLYLWSPMEGTKPVSRLLGHQKQVNHVAFSPDTNYIASASFDNSIKIWSRDGKFLNTLRGHVGPVYQCTFSADSRLVVSGSKDTTLKVWNLRTFKLAADLPGHEDEVYALDWSADGTRVGSGGKDKAVRVWRH